MASAKQIRVSPIDRNVANELVKRLHYSGSFVRNSQIHLGVSIGNYLEGVMQFGHSLDKRKIQSLVSETPWNGFIELNRMAFSERLPRNSESRALGVAMRLLRKTYHHIQWVVSFADAAQCGDGTIYRASGFVLTGISANRQIWESPNWSGGRIKETVSKITVTKGKWAKRSGGAATMRHYVESGWKPIDGYQLRYLYFLDPEAKERLTVPVIPFSKIDEIGARMYRGEKMRAKQAMAVPTAQRRGSADLHAPILESEE